MPFVRQPPEHGPPDPAEIGAQRNRLEDISAVPDPAVDVHGDALVHGGNDLGKRIERRQRAVELPPAVVRHDDPVDVVLQREPCVFRGRDPFHPDLHRRGDAFEPRDGRLPGEGRVGGVGVECDRPCGEDPLGAVLVAGGGAAAAGFLVLVLLLVF